MKPFVVKHLFSGDLFVCLGTINTGEHGYFFGFWALTGKFQTVPAHSVKFVSWDVEQF